MNLPNKLTVARLLSLPFLIACFYIDSPLGRWGLLILFVLASITDWLDGRIARSRNLVTNLGKFLDPIAGKALVSSGKVVAANIFGKAKTMFQMVSMTAILFLRALCGDPAWLITTSNILCWISALITALSGIVYVIDNKEILSEED